MKLSKDPIDVPEIITQSPERKAETKNETISTAVKSNTSAIKANRKNRNLIPKLIIAFGLLEAIAAAVGASGSSILDKAGYEEYDNREAAIATISGLPIVMLGLICITLLSGNNKDSDKSFIASAIVSAGVFSASAALGGQMIDSRMNSSKLAAAGAVGSAVTGTALTLAGKIASQVHSHFLH